MEDLEQIMRRIHVLFAKCEPYGDERENTIIVPKKEVFRLLEQLNYAVIALLDRYEGTAESRERGLAEYRRTGEKLVEQAQVGADDVYAASLIYTDNMLEELEDVLSEAKESLWGEYARVAEWLDGQARTLVENQEEIKRQLRAMAQGEKYLRLIYRENERLRRLAEQELEDESEDESEDDFEDDTEDDFEDESEDDFEDDAEDDFEDESEDDLKGSSVDDAESNSKDNVKSESGNASDSASGNASKDALRENAGKNSPKDSKNAGAHSLKKSPQGSSRSGSPKAPGSKEASDAKKSSKTKSGTAKSGKKKRRPAVKHPRMSSDLEAEWASEGERPVRKVGTALYEDVGEAYDPPVKKVSYEIKVNQAYFDQLGEGAVDLDAEYYQWKEEQEKLNAEGGAAAAQEEDAGKEEQSGQKPKREERRKKKKERRLRFGRRRNDA